MFIIYVHKLLIKTEIQNSLYSISDYDHTHIYVYYVVLQHWQKLSKKRRNTKFIFINNVAYFSNFFILTVHLRIKTYCVVSVKCAIIF